ncbi:WecB/TagA/CpsF family glycosyltransferase [Curvibacter sp. APW13]|uniref:WecB/TagA/CpsF family glycosyltransferase n=1 Tax=Curvibacter sp. APW13 TaxID=3077236 RepID=UPI0028DE39EA|nr:WecB/TagA/CpsF family glycosyltransferase [Curvibacter sp. APW13]MDT8992598.1 WecB/TagA/CpsF family glycosyltransferase [Curvibacter sp. APW13]
MALLTPTANISLAGYSIRSTNSAALSALLQERLVGHIKTVLVFANANCVMQCQHLRTWLSGENVVLVNDGIGVDIAAMMVVGHRFEENLNGTDFLPFLFTQLATQQKVYLVGGMPEIAERAGKFIEAKFGHQVVGIQDGFSRIDPVLLQTRINSSGADVVLVALGNPRQEEWIKANAPNLNAPLVIGVGALLDFLSGTVVRAPVWMRALHLEWLFRLGHEPRRLMRRYTIDIGRFLSLCLRYPRDPLKQVKANGVRR